MKFDKKLITAIATAAIMVAVAFALVQTSFQKKRLKSDLQKRIENIDNVITSKGTDWIEKDSKTVLEKKAETFSRQYQFLGLAVYYSADSLVALNPEVKELLKYSPNYISLALASGHFEGNFFKHDNTTVYQYIKPLSTNKSVYDQAIIFYVDAQYIVDISRHSWLRNFARSFILVLLTVLITILIVYWVVLSPINRIVKSLRAARKGNIEELKHEPPAFLAPLQKEIKNVVQAMAEARTMAEEEARLRSTGESVWTSERLKEEIKKLIPNKLMVVVSNREPYLHVYDGPNIKPVVPASGMITAMEPILEASGGLWIASATGEADKEVVDEKGKVNVPPDNPKYTLKRIWLTKEQESHYYEGFSNEGMWPLCHIAHTRPIFREEDWNYYQEVNQIFANAVLEEIKDEEQPYVLVQDFHFALLPRLIKQGHPDARVALFWHIPWPNPESFGICPWQEEILLGMLGADLIGFHTQFHCNNFLETVNNSLQSQVMWDNFSVKIGEQTTYVKPFPISIAFTPKDINLPEVNENAIKLIKGYGINVKSFGVGVDRIDYTKGLVEKFLAIERFFEKNPSYIGQFTFVQIGAPSRTGLKSYSDTIENMENEAARINQRFKARDWKPILLLEKHHSHEEIMPYYQEAKLCLVSSLHDGMNLVAKEFIASRVSNDGVLILSRFAGASQELQGAIVINPYDIEKTADAIKEALEMPEEEQQTRMKQMRQILVENNIYFWAANLLRSMVTIQS
jgi:trehalose 6-phosphate synthase